MDPVQCLEVLLYTEDGEEYRVRPLHSKHCTKHKSVNVSAFTCDGCRFDVACNELLSLHRVDLTEPFVTPEAANYEQN